MAKQAASIAAGQSAASQPAKTSSQANAERQRMIREGPIVSTMLRLALPTIIVFVAQSLTGVAETYYVSFLGTQALAGVSLVFPVMMLMIMVSNGGLGGGVASSIARAIGSGRKEDADALVTHALALAVGLGIAFMGLLLWYGEPIYRALGGSGEALDAARTYSICSFAGAVPMWIVALLSAALRGSGNFKVPANVTLLGTCLLVPLSPALIFGFGPIPRLGVAGAGISVTAYYVGAAIYLLRYVARSDSGVTLRLVGLQMRLFRDILKVGLLAGFNAILPNATVLAVTAAVGTYGIDALAGYGTASRIDFVLVPILFGLGSAVVTMVGVSIGAGDIARAKRIAWTSTLVGFLISEGVGLLLALAPWAWIHLFSREPAVVAVGSSYLHAIGPVYGALGVAMLLGFVAQGSGRVWWSTAAGVVRMLVAAGIGWCSVAYLGAGLPALFMIVAGALVCQGLINAAVTSLGAIWPGSTASR